METAKRQTAYQVWIKDMLEAPLQKEQELPFIQIKEDKVVRVNILATLVNKEVNDLGGSITLDDSSATVNIRIWQEQIGKVKEYGLGDIILCIGKVRETEEGREIQAEILKRIEEPLWIKVRQEELNKKYGKPTGRIEIKQQGQTEIEIRKMILQAIEELDKEDGADFFSIVTKISQDEDVVDKVVQSLLKDGEIFEIKPGKLRSMF